MDNVVENFDFLDVKTIEKLSKDHGPLSPNEKSSVINAAIGKIEKMAPRDESFEENARVANDLDIKKLSGAVMRMNEHWSDQQADRISTLAEEHLGLATVMHEQLVAVDREQKVALDRANSSRGLQERSSRSSTHGLP